MMGFSVREMTDADRDAVRKIYDDVAGELQHLEFAAPDNASENAVSRGVSDAKAEKPPTPFETATAGEKIFVAEKDGVIAGFSSVWEETKFIHFLFISRDFRGQGTGHALTEKITERYGAGLTLKCLKHNENAVGFYKKTGWETVGGGFSEDGEYLLMKR